MSLDKS